MGGLSSLSSNYFFQEETAGEVLSHEFICSLQFHFMKEE